MRTQDGMDWLGGGDTTVANSFSRAADDDFALEGNWDGYRPTGVAVVRIEVVNADVLRWDRRVRRAHRQRRRRRRRGRRRGGPSSCGRG
jgi:hypothetical protein